MRTTLDIDTPILRELKALAKRENKSLSRQASDLLARAMSAEGVLSVTCSASAGCWTSKAMDARVNLADSEALYSAMESKLYPDSCRVAEDTQEP